MRNAVRSAEGFINTNGIKIRGLSAWNFDEREEEAEALASRVDRLQQSDGHQLAQAGVVSLDCVGFA